MKKEDTMKNLVKSLAAAAAAIMVLGLGGHKANASGVDFRIGVNFGIPMVAATVYKPAPVYAHQPVRGYYVEKVRSMDHYGYRPGAYRYGHDNHYDRFGHDQSRHGGCDRSNHDGRVR
jgi:hypothetical protein